MWHASFREPLMQEYDHNIDDLFPREGVVNAK